MRQWLPFWVVTTYDVSVSVGRPAGPFAGPGLSSVDRNTVAATLRRELGLDWQRAKRVIDRVEIKGAARPLDD